MGHIAYHIWGGDPAWPCLTSGHTSTTITHMKSDLQSATAEGLLAQGMSAWLHWFPEDVPLAQLAEALTAMANSDGGVLLLGVSPRSSHAHGVHNPDRVRERVFQAGLLADPPLVLPLPRLEPVQGTHVVRVDVPPGLPHVYSLDGRYLGREGRHSAPLSARSLRQLLHARGVVQFESQIPPEAAWEDLDPEQIHAYLERVDSPEGLSPRETLVRRGCALVDGDQVRPTYAGLLLFGRHPQRWLPSATILAARFAGETLSDQFVKQELHGSLPRQLLGVEHFVRDNLRTHARVEGFVRQDALEYPLEAVRELLVNAAAHRDYNHQGDTIHLHIFSDRLEVHSPGSLPGPVTLDNLLEARFARNPVLAQVLSDLGYVERLGYGLDRVVIAMREHGLPPPQFSEIAGTFRVSLYNGAGADGQVVDLSGFEHLEMNPRQKLALSHLAAHGRITNRAYQTLCPDVHPETLRRDLAGLVSMDVLLKIGEKRATYYILKSISGRPGGLPAPG